MDYLYILFAQSLINAGSNYLHGKEKDSMLKRVRFQMKLK